MRIIVVFLIAFVCLFLSGCVPSMHAFTHPHSEITAPTFCLYDGHWTKQDAKPAAIYRIFVYREEKINDERVNLKSTKRRYADQDAWEIEYAPDGKSKPPEKPFSCITYGQVPPGYVEIIPAQPLGPERVYTVMIEPKGITPKSWVYFIIRADPSTGRPIQLEHTNYPRNVAGIRVITSQ